MISKTIISILVLPGLFGIIIPLFLVTNDMWRFDGYVAGLLIFSFGLSILLRCIYDFYVSGKGTLAPWAPPLNLVTTGLYKYSRNPMYIGVLAMDAGIGLYLGSPLILLYTIGLFFGFVKRVISYEEPYLSETFREKWKEYSQNVPRWIFKT